MKRREKRMKHVKKLVSILLAMVMVFSMSVSVFAATNNNSGSITIKDAKEGHTYNAYQILVLESYDTGAGAYTYKANLPWKAG